MSVIDVKHLTKDYGFGRGVFDVSFQVEKGEVLGFLGPNGAGKSTTIRHLMGFSKPDSGKTRIFGKESFHQYDKILKSVGYIPGEIALPAGLTGWEFLRMMQDMQGHRNKKKLDELLGLFELDPSGDTKRMSLGVKRKLAVVTAFMNDPDVLILDEPTSGLDPVMQDVFIDYLKNERNNKSRCEYIFINSRPPYNRMGPGSITKMVRNLLLEENVKLKHYGPHALRHSFATRMINSDKSMKEVADMLGHQKIDNTCIYAKVDVKSLHSVSDMNWEGLL
jgi:ABC-type Na+ transport system ATPase subunit NatA